jgi:hypothetical protein
MSQKDAVILYTTSNSTNGVFPRGGNPSEKYSNESV